MKKVVYVDSVDINSVDGILPEGQPFICIWDTDSIPHTFDFVRKVIDKGCLCMISIGEDSELFHDIFDETVVRINVVEENPFVEVDTRWRDENNTVVALEEALYEARNTMFEEVDSVCDMIYIFSSIRGDENGNPSKRGEECAR